MLMHSSSPIALHFAVIHCTIHRDPPNDPLHRDPLHRDPLHDSPSHYPLGTRPRVCGIQTHTELSNSLHLEMIAIVGSRDRNHAIVCETRSHQLCYILADSSEDNRLTVSPHSTLAPLNARPFGVCHFQLETFKSIWPDVKLRWSSDVKLRYKTQL